MSKSNQILLAYDQVEIGKSRIVADNARYLKIEAILSRVGVYKYDDGMWLKPASELRKATRTARYAKLTLNDHPLTKVIMSQEDLFGGVERPFFDNNKMRAVLAFDKEFVPEVTLQKVRSGQLHDVSIGFYYQPDYTPGWHKDVNTGKPTHYDGIMRNILVDHVVGGVGPHAQGRCRFPQCGIGLNTIMKRFSVGEDKVEKRGKQWCVIHCHGPNKGKPIKCWSGPEAKGKAEAMHKAIEARKSGSAQSIIDLASMLNVEDCGCGIHYKMVFGEAAEKPPKVWMNNCKSKAGSFADDPGAFCGWVFHHGPEALKTSFGSSSVLNLGGKDLSEQIEETPYAKCKHENVEGGMSPEEAAEECKDLKTDQDEPEQETAYEKCIKANKAEGMSQEEAEEACEGLKPIAVDQEFSSEEVKEKIAALVARRETLYKKMTTIAQAERADIETELGVIQAEIAALEQVLAKTLVQEIDQSAAAPGPEVEVPAEPMPNPVDACIKARMGEPHNESEATARAWCEDEAAGLHVPAEQIVDTINKLKAKERDLDDRRR